MLKKLSLFAVVGCAAALVFGAAAASGADQVKDTTITVIATHVHFTDADVGDTGPSPGDELVFTATDTTLAGEVVGRLDGYCVFTQISNGEDQFEECMLTHTLQGGQITLQGQFQQGAAGDQYFAVTGGTGVYNEANGHAVLRFERRFRFDLVLGD